LIIWQLALFVPLKGNIAQVMLPDGVWNVSESAWAVAGNPTVAAAVAPTAMPNAETTDFL